MSCLAPGRSSPISRSGEGRPRAIVLDTAGYDDRQDPQALFGPLREAILSADLL